jgi:hypothetical protein
VCQWCFRALQLIDLSGGSPPTSPLPKTAWLFKERTKQNHGPFVVRRFAGATGTFYPGGLIAPHCQISLCTALARVDLNCWLA